jgi:hypothetical protein
MALTTPAANAETAHDLLVRAQEIARANSLTQLEANAWHNLAMLALAAGKSEDAIQGYERALELFERTRARFELRSEERLASTSTRSETQRFLALACLAEDRLEAAWEAYEHSLAREAREALAESLLRSSAHFAESVRAQEHALEALRHAYERGASKEEMDARSRVLQASTEKMERDLHAQGGRERLPTLSIKEFSEHLKKNNTLALQYLIWNDEKPGIVFIIDGGGISAAQLPPSRRLLEDAARFRNLAAAPLRERVWDKTSLGTKLMDRRAEFVTNGLALSQVLLGPLQARANISFSDQATTANLLIITDGELAAFPFAALPLSGGDTPACLGDEVPIITTFSAAAWMEGEALAQKKGAIILAGDVGEREIRDGRILPALPGSGRELEGIAHIFAQKAQTVRGNAATRNALSSLLRESPEILHFATHGFFLTNTASGRLYGALLLASDESRVAHSAVPAKAGTPNGYVFDEEAITRLPLVGSLVTLSSCESARGRLVMGEGMLSLMRAFVMAGAKSVSASLWIVGGDSAAEYMQRYYTHIARGIRPAAAHRDTRRELRALGYFPSQRSGFITSN